MQTRTQRELYYSAEHWYAKMQRGFKYLDTIPCDFQGYLRDVPYEYNAGPERKAHIKELNVITRDRLAHARVMHFKMYNDGLRINGVAFNTMLDDEKKRLHKSIEDKAQKLFDRAINGPSVTERIQEYLKEFCGMYNRIMKPTPNYQPGGLAIIGETGPELVEVAGKIKLAYDNTVLVPKVKEEVHYGIDWGLKESATVVTQVSGRRFSKSFLFNQELLKEFKSRNVGNYNEALKDKELTKAQKRTFSVLNMFRKLK